MKTKKIIMKKTQILTLVLALMLTTNTKAQVWIEKAKSLPTTVESNQHYGISVSVDDNYAVVGAYFDNNETGCAYVLFFDGSSWITQAKLTASDGAAGEYFGCSVSISGDNIVVGAYCNDDKGSAYVFTKPVAGWANMTETAKLTASDGATYDSFGVSVSISGDNIVVGADSDDDNGSSSGSAYVFTKSGTSWINTTETAKLTTFNGEDHDYFGASVSIFGDNIVIGTQQNGYDGSNDIGSAYVFTKPVAGWTDDTTETVKLTASDGAAGDYFGASVSISGARIVIGANGDDDNGSSSGSAYLFINDNTSIKEELKNNIAIYPNPVSNELIIEIEGNNEKVNFEILNSIGQVVFKGNLIEKTVVQTNRFAPGVYLIKLRNGKNFEIKKIVK